MDKKAMRAQTMQVVRGALRRSGVVLTASAAERIPELLEAVAFDGEYLRGQAEAALNGRTGDPVGALLALMGLRATAIPGVGEERRFAVETAGDGRDGAALLGLDREALSAAVERMAADLAQAEAEMEAERQNSRGVSDRLFAELERKDRQCVELAAALHDQRSAVLECCQHILSLLGTADGQAQAGGLVYQLLEDLGAHVYWSAQGAPFSDGDMFLELPCDDPAGRMGRPCLADADGVLVKGVRFVAADAEPEEPVLDLEALIADWKEPGTV